MWTGSTLITRRQCTTPIPQTFIVLTKAYRLFNEHVHSVLSKGADILRQLDDEVESIYTNWYLYELGLARSSFGQ